MQRRKLTKFSGSEQRMAGVCLCNEPVFDRGSRFLHPGSSKNGHLSPSTLVSARTSSFSPPPDRSRIFNA